MPIQIPFPHGATPLDDLTGLIPSWVENLNDLNRIETENIALAKKKYFQKSLSNSSIWFRPKQLLSIHREMFCLVWKWAGTYRKSLKSIGPQPVLIPLQLAELCHDVHSWSKEPIELTFLEKAARIHHRLVSIHPFENGNGRFSRFISDMYLQSWKCHYPIWPSNLIDRSNARSRYINSLKKADHGDYVPLLELMIEFGAQEPDPSFYKKHLSHQQMEALLEACKRLMKN